MIRTARVLLGVFAAGWFICCMLWALTGWRVQAAPSAKTETLTCVRIKEVTPAGTINYLCEVRK